MSLRLGKNKTTILFLGSHAKGLHVYFGTFSPKKRYYQVLFIGQIKEIYPPLPSSFHFWQYSHEWILHDDETYAESNQITFIYIFARTTERFSNGIFWNLLFRLLHRVWTKTNRGRITNVGWTFILLLHNFLAK